MYVCLFWEDTGDLRVPSSTNAYQIKLFEFLFDVPGEHFTADVTCSCYEPHTEHPLTMKPRQEMALYFQYNQGLGTNESLLKTSPLTKNPDTQVRDPGYL